MSAPTDDPTSPEIAKLFQAALEEIRLDDPIEPSSLSMVLAPCLWSSTCWSKGGWDA